MMVGTRNAKDTRMALLMNPWRETDCALIVRELQHVGR